MGQRIRGAMSVFLPGRMQYEFDIDSRQIASDIPRTIYISKEDTPTVDWSEKVASILPATIVQLRDVIRRGLEERRKRKRDKLSGVEASYAVANKINVAKHRAKDIENDIFAGAGGFSVCEVLSAKVKTERPLGGPGVSYFDDAGATKYTKGIQYELDSDDIVTPHQTARAGKTLSKTSGTASIERLQSRNTTRVVPEDADAYGECFPEAGLGHARVATGGDSEDEQVGELKKKGKTDDDAEHKKKKSKPSEAQQWQKIDSMMRKRKGRSLETIETEVGFSGQSSKTMLTPVCF